jgi:hypothetical protein
VGVGSGFRTVLEQVFRTHRFGSYLEFKTYDHG